MVESWRPRPKSSHASKRSLLYARCAATIAAIGAPIQSAGRSGARQARGQGAGGDTASAVSAAKIAAGRIALARHANANPHDSPAATSSRRRARSSSRQMDSNATSRPSTRNA